MSYEAWRISFQSSEQAARAAYQQMEASKAERDALAAHVEGIKTLFKSTDAELPSKWQSEMYALFSQAPAASLARRDLSKRAEGTKLAALFIELKAYSYDEEHGTTDPSTGTREYPGDGAEYYNELMELAEELHKQAEGLQ